MKLLLNVLVPLFALGVTLSSKAAVAQRLGEEENNGRELTAHNGNGSSYSVSIV
jgi:hypothetical protein